MSEQEPQVTELPPAENTAPIDNPWRRLLELYRLELAELPVGPARSRLLYAIGRILDERLEERREALRTYEEAVRQDPAFHPPRRALRRSYREMEQPELVALQLATEAQDAPTPQERAQLLWEEGQLHEGLGALEQAMHCYRQALEALPSFLPALWALEPHLIRRDQHPELASLIEQVLPHCSDATHQASLHIALGRLRESRFEDLPGAIAAYQEAVRCQPFEVEALAALERLGRRLHRWSELAQVLEQEAALSEGGPSGAATLLEVARIRGDLLGDREGARQALEDAVAQEPHHRPSLEALAALLTAPEDRPRLADLLDRWAAVETEPRERADLLSRRAGLLFELGRTEEAVGALEEAHRSYPHHQPTLQALGEHYQRTGDYRSLAQMQLEQARGLEDPDQRSRSLLRTAEILEGKLGDTAAALAVLREALDTGPGRLAVIREISRLLGKTGRWDELDQVLTREVERTGDPEQVLLHLQELARVREEHLADPAGAASALEQAIRLRPDHRPSLEKLALLYRHLGRWENRVRILLGLAELLDDARSVVAVLTEAGRTSEEGLGDITAASELYERALRLHPGFGPALQAQGRLLSATARWSELIEMHRRSLEVASTPDERADLHNRIGHLLWHRCDQLDLAIGHYRATLQHRPGDITALKALETAATLRGTREELAEVLRLQAEAATDAATAAQLYCRQGAVLEGLPEGEPLALGAYQQALALDPRFLPAYRSLIRLHGSANRWPEVAQIISQLLEVEAEPAQRVLLLMRLATIQREQLGQKEAAQETYQRVLQLDPGHPSALRALEEMLRQENDPLRLVPVLEARARTLEQPLLVGAYLLEIERLGPLATRQTRSPEALLARAMRQPPWCRAGLERLESLLIRRMEPSSLADFYERAAGVVAEPQLRQDMLIRQAELLEQADRLEEAQALYQELLTRSPRELTLIKGLQRVLAARGDRTALLAAIEMEGLVAAAGPRMVPALLAAGEEWLTLGRPDRARNLFELALQRHPDSLDALRRLELHLVEQGEQTAFLELLEQLLPQVTTPHARLEIQLRLALRAEEQSDLVTAQGYLAAALTAVPDDLRAHHAQARIAEVLDSHEVAAREWLTVAEHPDAPPPLLREARLALGRLWGLELGQPVRAIAQLEQVLQAEPRDLEALTTLQDVLAADRRWNDLEEVIQRRLELARPEEQVEILLEWARIEEEERRDRVSAYQLLQDARKLDPTAAEPVRQIGRILWEDGAYDTLRTLFLEYADGLSSHNIGRAIPFLSQLGQIYMESYSTTADAVALLKRVLDIDPHLLEVRQQLAELYGRQSETLQLAIEQHQLILEADPLQLDSLTTMFNTFERLRAHDRAFAVGGVLEYVGALAPEDRAGMEEYRTRALREARRDLSPAERLSLLPFPEEGEPLDQWLRLVVKVLPKIFPENLKERGIVKGFRVGSRAQDPILSHCNRLASSLGVREFQLYRLPEAPFQLEVAATDPPALLLADRVLDRWNLAQRRFQLARAMASLTNGLLALAALGEATLAALLVASVRIEDDSVQVQGVDEGAVDHCLTALDAALPGRLRRPLAELGRLVLNSPMSLTDQLRRTGFSLQRAGLFFAGDVAVVLGELAGQPAATENLAERLARLQQCPAALDLVSWVLTDRYAELRRSVGTAVD